MYTRSCTTRARVRDGGNQWHDPALSHTHAIFMSVLLLLSEPTDEKTCDRDVSYLTTLVCFVAGGVVSREEEEGEPVIQSTTAPPEAARRDLISSPYL